MADEYLFLIAPRPRVSFPVSFEEGTSGETQVLSASSGMDIEDIDALKVTEIKRELQARNLDLSGKKSVLVLRLRDAIDAENRKIAEERRLALFEEQRLAEEPASKKAKTEPTLHMKTDNAVDKADEGESVTGIANAPISATRVIAHVPQQAAMH